MNIILICLWLGGFLVGLGLGINIGKHKSEQKGN